MNVDTETSKAQLRARVRSERAARATRDHNSPTVKADPSDSESSGSDSSNSDPSVAGSAWQLIESLWPNADLTGKSMLAYAALAGEPDLDPVIDRFLANGATVYLPVVTAVGQPLKFGAVTESMATLEPRGKWGIREPAPTLTASDLLAEAAPDLVFVPALGFGPALELGSGGARLGNGGGFYDRTFGPQGEVPLTSGDRTSLVYGVCFSTELGLPGLIVEPWDLQITRAVTDHGVHTFG